MILEKIRKLCKEHGISLRALERELGIGNGVIARWETSMPRVDKLQAVADYFDCTIDSLVCDIPKGE